MAEDTAPRFVEQEVTNGSVVRDETRLLPHGLPRRWLKSTYDDITDFTLGMAVDDMHDPIRSHSRTLALSTQRRMVMTRDIVATG